uniref:Ig-like domain-containing protein n=1 Tax=Chelonoidis abingdonii TaxID=106734 RepID=A0A8C0HAJ1_CHEAB
MRSCAGWGPVAGSLCQPLPAQSLCLMAFLFLLPEPTLPKPSISPSREVSVGGSVSIQCLGLRPGVRFVLNKGGRHAAHVDTDKSQFVFPINNVQWEQGGNYSCSHHSRSEPFTEWSDPVELVVREPSYPKPNISGIPSRVVSLGAAVTIRCEGQHQGMRFLLNKEGRHFPPVDSGGFVAEFLIRNVSREDGGSYNCSYHSRSEPFNVSYPSDPMELVVRGEGPSSVSPFPASHPGEAVTIRCECQCLGVRFLLRKDGAMAGHHTTDPALDVVEFPIRNVSQGDAGSYSCRYRTKWDPLVWSEPSHSVELVVAGEGTSPETETQDSWVLSLAWDGEWGLGVTTGGAGSQDSWVLLLSLSLSPRRESEAAATVCKSHVRG